MTEHRQVFKRCPVCQRHALQGVRPDNMVSYQCKCGHEFDITLALMAAGAKPGLKLGSLTFVKPTDEKPSLNARRARGMKWVVSCECGRAEERYWSRLRDRARGGEFLRCDVCAAAAMIPSDQDPTSKMFPAWRDFMRQLHELSPPVYAEALRQQRVSISRAAFDSCSQVNERKVPFRSAWLELQSDRAASSFGYEILAGIVTLWSRVDGRIKRATSWILNEDGELPADCEDEVLPVINAVALAYCDKMRSPVVSVRLAEGDPAKPYDGRGVRTIALTKEEVSVGGLVAAVAAKKRRHEVRGHWRHLSKGAVYIRPHVRGSEDGGQKITDLRFDAPA